MHQQSLDIMKNLFDKYLDSSAHLNILDVGSADVNGSYRQLIPDTWNYTGTDVEAGAGVDVVMPEAFELPFDEGAFDVVLCGQVLEHCSNPFALVDEMARVLDTDGYMFIIVPAICTYHAYPQDCFRIYPDGLRAVMEHSDIDVVDAYTVPADGLKNYSKHQIVDTVGVGKQACEWSVICCSEDYNE